MYLRLTVSTIQSNLYIKDIVADLSVEMVNGQFLDYLKSINQWLPIHSYSSRASSQIVIIMTMSSLIEKKPLIEKKTFFMKNNYRSKESLKNTKG
jgi:hypothetical protein